MRNIQQLKYNGLNQVFVPTPDQFNKLIQEVQAARHISTEPSLEAIATQGGTHIRFNNSLSNTFTAVITDCATKMCVTTLAHAITSDSATTITVTSADLFPTSGDYTICVGQGGNLANEYTTQSEVMLVTGGQGTDTWTVTRAQQDTTAQKQFCGAAVFLFSPDAVVDGALTSVDGVPGDTLLEDYGIAFNDEQVGDYNDTNAVGYASYFSVNDDSNLPSVAPFQVKIDGELITVTSIDISDDVSYYYCQRGQGGTAFIQHSPDSIVQVVGYGPYSWSEIVSATTGSIPLIGGQQGTFNAWCSSPISILAIDGSVVVDLYQDGAGYAFEYDNIVWYDRSGSVCLADQYMGRGNKVFDGLFLNWAPEIGQAGGFIGVPNSIETDVQGVSTNWWSYECNIAFPYRYGLYWINNFGFGSPWQASQLGGITETGNGSGVTGDALDIINAITWSYTPPTTSTSGAAGLSHANAFNICITTSGCVGYSFRESSLDSFVNINSTGFVGAANGFFVGGTSTLNLPGSNTNSVFGIGAISNVGGVLTGTRFQSTGQVFGGGILLNNGFSASSWSNVDATPLNNDSGININGDGSSNLTFTGSGAGMVLQNGAGGISVEPGGGSVDLQGLSIAGALTLESGSSLVGDTGSTASFATGSVDNDDGQW